ncbi:GDP-mannose 4,6-dehydratase [Phytomonospora sp. NPDC050363]|uniref:GDP-mannose 4,6-dehydratase n=1 Tax=Phytomonospora sp. NPDC050363 TaxID=3155642 RepID=UPI0033F4FBF9
MLEQSWSEAERAGLLAEFGDLYRDRAALVTGADGFLGSHLTDALVSLGARVHTVVRARSGRSLTNLEHLRENVTITWGDLSDRHTVDRAVRALAADDEKPFVFNFAAQPHVHRSWTQPYETVSSNIIATLNLLQSIVDHGLELQHFDQVGTSEEYGNSHGRQFTEDVQRIEVTFDEESPLDPRSIYGTTKVAQDFLARNYHAAYGVPVTVVRLFNHFGPRQTYDFITGTVITQALQRDTVILGDTRPSRDFTYCTDGVRAHLATAATVASGDVYTYGNGQDISIREWARLILAVGRSKGHWGECEIVEDRSLMRPGGTEVLALKVDYGKIRSVTGWQPTVNWEDGILRTIEWFARNRSRWGSLPALV